ncbi:MAG: PDZ domain-containing protein [Nitrospirae bacterium]|nr:PDZ domain-containing protein [Nitrospirota bacterium]MBF0541260.1 PDZ domain-containing protein [Nitrospirota bacterium]
MKRSYLIIYISFILLLFIGCSSVEQHNTVMPAVPDIESYKNEHILSKMTEGKIAVLPFATTPPTGGGGGGGAQSSGGGAKKGPIDILGWKYAEEFTLFFGSLKRFDMVERLQVEKVLEEQNVDPSKIDDKIALKIGRLLGAVGVVIGTTSNDYFNIRLVETDTGVHAWNVRAVVAKMDHEKASFRREWAANLVSTLRDATIGIRVIKRPPVLVYSPPIRFENPETNKPKPIAAAKTPAGKNTPKIPEPKAEEPKQEWQDMPGVVIADFTIDSLAPKNGLKKGDIIERVEDTVIKDATDLLVATFNKKPGDKITLFVLRDEKYYKAIVTLTPTTKK